jgi:hypothetical protein
MASWKILTGRTLSFYAANESTTDSINAAIQRHLSLGWILKGPMLCAHPSSEIWSQCMVLPRK